jgi:hypothetical protein
MQYHAGRCSTKNRNMPSLSMFNVRLDIARLGIGHIDEEHTSLVHRLLVMWLPGRTLQRAPTTNCNSYLCNLRK